MENRHTVQGFNAEPLELLGLRHRVILAVVLDGE